MKLPGKVVVITGAANGLGRALAYEFNTHNAVIVAVDQDDVGLASLQNQLPDLVTITADVTAPSELKRVLDDTLKIHSQLDIWINNAGILAADGPALEQDVLEIRRVFDVNTLALIDGSIVAGNHLKAKVDGWIVNILSSTALETSPGRSIYSASKHAGHGFSRALKAELKNVKVLAVYPEGIKTQLFGDSEEANYQLFMSGEQVARQIISAIINEETQDLIIKR